MKPVVHLNFDRVRFAQEDRIDAVQNLWRNYPTLNLYPNCRSGFFLSSNVWWMNDCTFVHFRAAPINCLRPPLPDKENLISISYLKRCRQYCAWGDSLEPKSLDAVHISNPRDQVLSDCPTNSEIFVLYVPSVRLGKLPGEAIPSRVFSIESSVGAVLRSLLFNLRKSLDECSLEDGNKLADGICGFLEPLLREPPDRDAMRESSARRKVIQRYIENNIKDASLSPNVLCEKFGVSRATLYRLFNQTNGVAGYITRRRTQLAVSELTRSPPRRGIIRAIAEKYGFNDSRQFYRAFRKHTGATPASFIGKS